MINNDADDEVYESEEESDFNDESDNECDDQIPTN